jgi:prepilin-type N-terminal cleavage/methylation domain-containing protein
MVGNKPKGFTFIELLVVIGIIVTLGAVAVPTVARFVAPAHATANDDEIIRVQQAMDTYIAENNLPPPTVAANSTVSNDFSSSDPVLFPGYMRKANTRCIYTWDANGHVTQDNCPP